MNSKHRNDEPMDTKVSHFRLMTYNIGGGRDKIGHKRIDFEDFGSLLDNVTQVVLDRSPDILVLQETSEWEDADNNLFNTATAIADKAGYKDCYFGPTLSLTEHFHPGRVILIHSIFNDLQEWRQGNAILSRWNFSRLSDPTKSGKPYNLPLFRPLEYKGNRDTDPRYAILARIKSETAAPFVIATHLSTLVGERGGRDPNEAGIAQDAQNKRLDQISKLIDLIKEHLLDKNELVFLLGDLNATVDEPCIKKLGDEGFVRLTPTDDLPTHPKVEGPIDHIFVYPKSRLVKHMCEIVNTPFDETAPDHRPVVADVWVV